MEDSGSYSMRVGKVGGFDGHVFQDVPGDVLDAELLESFSNIPRNLTTPELLRMYRVLREKTSTKEVGFLDKIFDKLLKLGGNPDNKRDISKVAVPVDIGLESSFMGESRIRMVTFDSIGIVPYTTNNGRITSYLAFSVGNFSPATASYSRDQIEFLTRFDNFSTLLALRVPNSFGERLLDPSLRAEKKLPFDLVDAQDQYSGLTNNPFELIVSAANEIRTNSPEDELLARDVLESSIVICDENGLPHTVPKEFEARRHYSLNDGIVPYIPKETSRNDILRDKGLVTLIAERILSGRSRNFQPNHINDVKRRKIDFGNTGPSGYGSTAFSARGPVERTNASSRRGAN